MRFFLDSANIDHLQQAINWGVISGLTTNPSLVAREEGSFVALIERLARLVSGPVSADVVADKAAQMVEEGRQLAAIAPNIVVKIPITAEGLQALSLLSGEGIKTNVTLVFSVNQALLAARAGAAYVSPFVGRIDDTGGNGAELVAEITDIFRRYEIKTQVIAASIRHPRHVIEAARAGAHIATLPFEVLSQMVKHPLTDRGIQRFAEDWRQAQTKGMKGIGY